MKKTINNKYKIQNGITLIALVITIIVLLILAGVAVNMAINSDGLFGKANEAATSWNMAVELEGTEISQLLEKANLVVGGEHKHSWNSSTGKCDGCEEECEHTWENGQCTVCGMSCTHTWSNGTCSTCGVTCTHTWSNGTCSTCGVTCTHTWSNGTCSTCGMNCTHTWSNGACSACGTTCNHSWTDGTCSTCGATCSRHSWSEGVCTTCFAVCAHNVSYYHEMRVHVCTDCGAQTAWVANPCDELRHYCELCQTYEDCFEGYLAGCCQGCCRPCLLCNGMGAVGGCLECRMCSVCYDETGWCGCTTEDE